MQNKIRNHQIMSVAIVSLCFSICGCVTNDKGEPQWPFWGSRSNTTQAPPPGTGDIHPIQSQPVQVQNGTPVQLEGLGTTSTTSPSNTTSPIGSSSTSSYVPPLIQHSSENSGVAVTYVAPSSSLGHGGTEIEEIPVEFVSTPNSNSRENRNTIPTIKTSMPTYYFNTNNNHTCQTIDACDENGYFTSSHGQQMRLVNGHVYQLTQYRHETTPPNLQVIPGSYGDRQSGNTSIFTQPSNSSLPSQFSYLSAEEMTQEMGQMPSISYESLLKQDPTHSQNFDTNSVTTVIQKEMVILPEGSDIETVPSLNPAQFANAGNIFSDDQFTIDDMPKSSDTSLWQLWANQDLDYLTGKKRSTGIGNSNSVNIENNKPKYIAFNAPVNPTTTLSGVSIGQPNNAVKIINSQFATQTQPVMLHGNPPTLILGQSPCQPCKSVFFYLKK